ncbi:MAG TPA: ABC transporter permease, partial [Chitinophagaceae bacterium]|nr:ABC transporter permease [Chitinophagaceae bacterium]
RLRTGITVAIIAFGIMALIGIVTAISAMNQKLMESFSTMGANGFTIRFKERNIRFGNGGSDVKLSRKEQKRERKSSLGKPITEDEAEAFLHQYTFPATVSLSTMATRNATVQYSSWKTSPNVMLFGTDEHYLQLNGFSLYAGRNLNPRDVSSGGYYCLLGFDVAKRLFKTGPEKAVGQLVRVNGIPYRVVGVLAARGSTLGFSRDNLVLTGYRNARRAFNNSGSFMIGVLTNDLLQVDDATGEAEGSFRAIRKLNITEGSNFVIDRSDSVAEKAMNSLGFLTAAVLIIGIITLIGAGIGLMNIMLVSVTERTKEVGLIKAIGGKSSAVRMQFLIESVIISVLGALFGIVLGVGVGNLFSLVLSTGFVVPWNWVLYGVVICSLVGLAAGLYPAWKAGRLNPIEALRYE